MFIDKHGIYVRALLKDLQGNVTKHHDWQSFWYAEYRY